MSDTEPCPGPAPRPARNVLQAPQIAGYRLTAFASAEARRLAWWKGDRELHARGELAAWLRNNPPEAPGATAALVRCYAGGGWRRRNRHGHGVELVAAFQACALGDGGPLIWEPIDAGF